MKKILYIHGSFSAFKPNSEKVKALSKQFEVFGLSYSMETPFSQIVDMFVSFCRENKIEAVVGTSLGGLFAAEVGSLLSIPSMLINPSIEPLSTLPRIVGTQKNYTTDKMETFTQELAESYPENIKLTDRCIVAVGLKDTVINPLKTISLSEGVVHSIVVDENADHYWEFFEANEELISLMDVDSKYSKVCKKNIAKAFRK